MGFGLEALKDWKGFKNCIEKLQIKLQNLREFFKNMEFYRKFVQKREIIKTIIVQWGLGAELADVIEFLRPFHKCSPSNLKFPSKSEDLPRFPFIIPWLMIRRWRNTQNSWQTVNLQRKIVKYFLLLNKILIGNEIRKQPQKEPMISSRILKKGFLNVRNFILQHVDLKV